MNPRARSLIALTAFAAGVLAAGCTTPRSADTATSVPIPSRFLESPRDAARASFRSGSWWETLDDKALDRLVEAALDGNFGLREAATRVAAAEASLRQARAQLFPSLDGTGEVSDRWGGESGGDGANSDASIGALLDWEIDVFGRLRAARRAEARELDATRADLAGARLVLSATIAEAHFGRAEQQRQLALLGEQIKVNETLLRLTRLRFGQAQASIVDVLQQEQQLKATRSRVPTVEARIAELGYTLDALVGGLPGDSPPSAGADLPAPPPLPAIGLPSDLLFNRPDLIAAQERIASLDARVAQAVAERFPRFRISATSSLESGSSLGSRLVADVVAPIFDAGTRRAAVAGRRAELEGAVAAFADTFVGALRDVESALANERGQAERLRRQEIQLESAKRLLTESRNRYSQGLTDYLPVLAALTTVQQLERDLVTTRRERLSQRIALHRALGGPL